MECYTPVEIAERCFLSEAIFWLLLREVPTVEEGSGAANDDARFSDDSAGEGGYWVNLTGLTLADCEKLGIPPNPIEELEDFTSDGVTLVTLDLLDDYEHRGSSLADMIYQDHSKEEIEKARKLLEKHPEWLEIVDSRMELSRVQILQEILQGKLAVFCRNHIEHVLEDDEDPNEIDAADDEIFIDSDDPRAFVEAPLNVFKAKNIDWQLSCSTIDKLRFRDICVDTMALLRLFPDPDEHAVTVSRVGNVLFLEDDDLPAHNRPKRGRPLLPWAEMHRELGRWIERDSIPDKKEALVAELMEWCKMKWGRTVSRSAIQSQLGNFSKDRK